MNGWGDYDVGLPELPVIRMINCFKLRWEESDAATMDLSDGHVDLPFTRHPGKNSRSIDNTLPVIQVS
jgi:hypothetical protein